MKKLALLISAALLLSSQAFATTSDAAFTLNYANPLLCEMEQEAGTETIDMASGSNDATLTISCNNPMATLSIKSGNGALKNDEGTSEIEYTALLNLAAITGFSPTELTYNPGDGEISTSSFGKTLTDAEIPFTVTLVEPAAGEPAPAAGDYTDTLTFTLSSS